MTTPTGAISSAPGYDVSKHGVLSSVIRYYTPYKDIHDNRLLFCVALGNDMTVNTILGNPVINQWQLELKFNPRGRVWPQLGGTGKCNIIFGSLDLCVCVF